MSQQSTFSPATSPSSPADSPLKKAFANRAFLAAVIILAVVGVGMQFMVNFMQVYFKKEPVPLRAPLITIPDTIGPWVKVSTDDSLPKETEDALAANEYIFRDYIDTRAIGQDKVDALLKMAPKERRNEVGMIEQRTPRAVVHFAVTYYTGLVDTVAHIPDRCYIADGYEPTEYKTENWKLADGSAVEVRYINFEDTTGFLSKKPKNVAYFFQVNETMESDPLAVRGRLQNLFNRHGYYAKIEIMTTQLDREESAGVMKDFLTVAMPEVHKRLPALPGEQASPTPAATQPATAPAPVTAAAEQGGSVATGSDGR